MKKNIKKIIVGMFGLFMFLGLATGASASSVWNGASNDCPDINIANYTTNTGYGSPCWYGTNISAKPGDVINVKVYYHNTSSATATNVRLKIFAPSGSSNSHSFSAQILSDQGNLYTGTVSVNLSASSSLSLLSTKWYPNQSSSNSSLLNGQSSSAVTSSNGLYIGSIAPGWSTQGTINVAFKVNEVVEPETCKDTSATNYGGSLPCEYPQKVCTIKSFYASDYSITKGEASKIYWDTENCTSVTVYPVIGRPANSGSQYVYPTSSTTYTLEAYGNNTTKTKQLTISVDNVVPETCKDTSATNYGGSLPCEYPKPMSGNLSASSSSCTIASGSSSCSIPFSWTTQNPKGTSSITHDYLTVATGNNGNKTFSIREGNQTYYLYNNGQLLDSETVTANCASNSSWNGTYCAPITVSSCRISSFYASDYSITKGEASRVYWGTENCNSVAIYPIIGKTTSSGSQYVYPTSSTTYTIEAYGNDGVKTKQLTISVENIIPETCKDTSATNYGGSLPCEYPQKVCTIKSFYASDYSITKGGSSNLSWSTSNCSSVNISNIGIVNSSGSRNVYPTNTTTYTLEAYGEGDTRSSTVTINVSNSSDNNDEYCTIDSFTASDTSIEEGDSTKLRWNTSGCDKVKISEGVGYVDEDGSENVSPDEDTIYTLTAYDDNGYTRTKDLRIYVDEDDDYDDNDDEDYCAIDSFTASDTSIDKGDGTTLKWRTTDCNEVALSGVGYVNEDDSEEVYPLSRTTYTLKAYGNGRTRTKTITINVSASSISSIITNPVISAPIYNNNVVTTVATNVGASGAQLNGLITDSNYTYSNYYFEYGRSVDLGSRTQTRQSNGNTNISDYISGLSPDTVYFFQAVSESSNGVSRGAIEVFKTPKVASNSYISTNSNSTKKVSTVTNTKQTVQSKTVYGSTSPLVLEIRNKYKNITVGDVVDYTVYYKNISSSELRNPMIQVYIPEGIIVTNLSDGTYSESDRTVSVEVDDLNQNDEGEIYIKAQVEDINKNLAQIVTTATLIYTNPNDAQENVMAYVLNNPRVTSSKDSNLGASAFFSGIFGGFGLIGWLIFIILILLIILISRRIWGQYYIGKKE